MERLEKYDREFKLNAIRLGSELGVSKASKQLAIDSSNIYKWKKELLKYGDKSFCGTGKSRFNPEQKIFSEQKIKLQRELRQLQFKIEIFKSSSEYVSQGRLMTYCFIENNLKKYKLKKLCKALGVGINSYKNWKNQIVSPTLLRTNLIKEQITSIFFEYKEIYGSAKIAVELQSRGISIGKRQICDYMRDLGLVSKFRRNYKSKSSSRFYSCTFPNVLNQQFTIEEPSKAWVSGITRLQTKSGLLFLTIIMDLFDRKIIGWSLSNGLSVKDTTMAAWKMAVKIRKTKMGLIFHSNRGMQYANKMFVHKLDSYKLIIRSMNRIGNHSDNAVCESFFISLKSELVDLNNLLTKKQMEEKITEYLENL
ncbi:IS3 family transposase [Flavobacterium sp. HJSW_4]|uniref:IS3 family transposase n=1 Tax=Flavobacterium sp. HJSW_4 TaxID=3344660 RepID=UPI0035F4B6D8